MPTQWTDPVLIPRKTINKAIHVTELRQAVNSAENSIDEIREILKNPFLSTSYSSEDLLGGELMPEPKSWGGYCRSLTQPSEGATPQIVAHLTIEGLRYFPYSFAVRMRSSNVDPIEVVKLRVSMLNEETWSIILESGITGDIFPNPDDFYTVVVGFDHSGPGTTLKFEVESQAISSLKVDVDGFFVSPAQGALVVS